MSQDKTVIIKERKKTIVERLVILLRQKSNVEAELFDLINLRDENKPKTGARGKCRRTESQKASRAGKQAIFNDASIRIRKMNELLDLMVTIRVMKKHTNHSVTKFLNMAEDLLNNLKKS
jgi:hypothetical protein